MSYDIHSRNGGTVKTRKKPDWKKPEHYELKLDRAGWAWEFMRRNPQYRADYRNATQDLAASLTLSFGRRGETLARDADRRAIQYGAKWGQRGPIADPRSDRVPRFFRFAVETEAEMLGAFYQKADDRDAVIQHPDFATLTFRLAESIDQQLTRAKRLLKERQKGKVVSKPVYKGAKQWPVYLRILDAREAEATSEEIIDAIPLFTLKAKDKEPGYANKKLWAYVESAEKLRDDPLRLIR